MITILASLVINPALASPEIVTASLFKNGYALVVRKVPVSGSTTTVTEIPQAALGTFWITSSGDVKIVELVATQEERSESVKAASFDEFLRLNIGKDVLLQTVNLGMIEGRIFNIQGETLMLEKAGAHIMISRSEIRSVTIGREAVTTSSVKRMQRVLRFSTTGKGDLLLFGLERGMTWAPAYAVELETDKRLSLTAKSTILNDLGDVQNIEINLVTGFPNVPWATLSEPLLSGQSVDQFTNFLASTGIPDAGFRGRRDAMSQNMAPGGALGGFDQSFAVNTGTGTQSEDLFFYSRPGVTLKKGDRGAYILFQAKSDYSHLYTTEIPDNVADNVRYVARPEAPNDVWHSLKLTNTSGQPLTTAPVTVFKQGKLLGQDTLMFTSAGAPLMIKMSKALDIRVEANEEELERQRAALRLPNGSVFDLVTLKGTVSIRSYKQEAVDMRVQKELTGEVSSSTGSPTVTKLAKGLAEVNPRSRLTWTPTLAGGKAMEFSYTYKVYVQ